MKINKNNCCENEFILDIDFFDGELLRMVDINENNYIINKLNYKYG